MLNRFFCSLIFILSYTSIALCCSSGFDDVERLHVDRHTDVGHLIKHWNSKPNMTSEDRQRINDRINALQTTCANQGKLFDYSSIVSPLDIKDHYFLEFSNTYGTQLDYQLHKELCDTRHRVNELMRTLPENEHVLSLAPIVHLYAAYAKTEKNPFFAFEIADFCRIITQVLSQGVEVLRDASLAIGKGAYQGASEFFTPEHWYGIGCGIIQLGALCTQFISEPNLATFLLLPDCLQNPDTMYQLAQKDYLRIKNDLSALSQRMQNTYQKIQNMSWQEIVQKSAHTSILLTLQILTFHALSSFLFVEAVPVANQTYGAAQCASAGYEIEIEGLKRIAIANPPLVPVRVVSIIKNNHSCLMQITDIAKNIRPILPNVKNIIEKRVGTVWSSIKPTDLMYPGTKIPKSFELTVGNQKFWVAPNATKHMEDYIKRNIEFIMPINCQSLLVSLKAEVEKAVSQGIVYNEKMIFDCWDIMFDTPRREGLLPTIYHANFKPTGWVSK